MRLYSLISGQTLERSCYETWHP